MGHSHRFRCVLSRGLGSLRDDLSLVVGALDETLPAEKRRYRRRKTKGRALLVVGGSRKPFRATVVDKMEKGARILVKQAGQVPDELYLIDLDSGMAHEANVAWRAAEEIGVEFARSIVLDATTPRNLLHLRELWMRAA